MKFYLPKKAKGLAVLVMLFSGLLMQRCAKEKQEPQSGGELTKLIVNVAGIHEKEIENPGKLKASSALEKSTIQSGDLSGELHKYDGFDALVSVKQDVQHSKGPAKLKASSVTGSRNLRMSSPVEQGVKYRLLIYTKQGSFVSSHLLSSGTASVINVNQDEDYNWYALSYNSTQDIQDVDPINPVLNLPPDKDVLYGSGEILLASSPQSGSVPLDIIFKHSFARIVIELNTMGMFADMVSAVVSISGADTKSGTMDLRTGVISNLSSTIQSIDFSNFTNVEPLLGDRKSVSFYTAAETALTDLKVTISGLELAIDDGSTRSFTDLLNTPSVFTFVLNPVLGSSHTAQINLVESTLNFQNRKWARQNLYYHGGHNPYRFHHTYAHTNAPNTYFSFKGLVPGQYGSDLSNDPCALVYPEGLWRTAGFNDYSFLTPIYPTEIFGTENGLGYIEYDVTTGTEAPYPGNNLRFNMNGTATANGVVGEIIAIDLGNTYGYTAELWTSSQYLDYASPDKGGYYYKGALGFGDNVNKQVFNEPVAGSQDFESDFKNIRCVR